MAARKRASPKRSGATSTSPQEPSASAASTASASPGGSEALSTRAAPWPARASASPWSRISATSGEMTIVSPSSARPGQLVAERLARARRHDDERVTPGERRLDGLLLPGAKRLVPEQALQMCGRVHPGNLAAGVDALPREA